jgi:prevent-host-death family protein
MVGYSKIKMKDTMPKSQSTIITATELKHKSGEIIRRAAKNGEHFVVERSGYPVVAIVPIQDYQQLTSSNDTGD